MTFRTFSHPFNTLFQRNFPYICEKITAIMTDNDAGTLREHKEYEYRGLIVSGFLMLFFTLIVIPSLILLCFLFFIEGTDSNPSKITGGVLMALLGLTFLMGLSGYFVQEPNQARVMTFFGKYRGTCRKTGYFWVNPFVSHQKISLRIGNMDIQPIKVNDLIGNPVMIGMVLVWKVCDTYRAVFDIDSQSIGGARINFSVLSNFVRIQADAALREVTGHFAYDDAEAREDRLTLRDGGEQISELLEKKLNERLSMAGIEVVEARLNYLAYAPEIAAVMLKRQQANAVIAAREKIVEGAVSMVHLALEKIDKENVAHFDERQRAAMVSNLMVVLCSDEPTQPVLNTSES